MCVGVLESQTGRLRSTIYHEPMDDDEAKFNALIGNVFRYNSRATMPERDLIIGERPDDDSDFEGL
uniref:(California timema) hypothetical protein n=1 Tax=Timema californicum TaxID=61474 RepID=A0A7R9JJ54_TIMCA|nr:unnamed protein product [Timema californicum]